MKHKEHSCSDPYCIHGWKGVFFIIYFAACAIAAFLAVVTMQ